MQKASRRTNPTDHNICDWIRKPTERKRKIKKEPTLVRGWLRRNSLNNNPCTIYKVE